MIRSWIPGFLVFGLLLGFSHGVVEERDASGPPAPKTDPADWTPFKENGLWGFRDKRGRTVITPRFFHAGRFNGGLAAVATGTFPNPKWGFIFPSGSYAISPRFQWAKSFEGDSNSTLVLINDRYNSIDRKGDTHLPIEMVEVFTEYITGTATVEIDGIKYYWLEGRWTSQRYCPGCRD